MSKTVVFFGNERIATGVATSAPTLQALIKHGYTIAAVVSNYEKGLSRNARHLEIAEVAKSHNIPVWTPEKPLDIKEALTALGADIGVLVAYGKIVPKSIIDIFPKGVTNIHPSLLPLHRGPTPVESAILQGQRTTGVSLMQLAQAMDAGPVYAQTELPLQGNETKQALADALLRLGSNMLIDFLPKILAGQVTATPQDDTQATYDSLLAKTEGTLDWNKPAMQLEREVRAFATWPQSRTTLGGIDVIITKVRVGETPDQSSNATGHAAATSQKEIAVQTGKDLLIVERLKPAGRSEMTSQAFLAGHTL